MAIKPGIKDFLWTVPTVLLLLVAALAALHYYRTHSPVEGLAFKARRVSLVDQMGLSLASASEGEKSAVLAITDEDSLTFADQARAATAAVERARLELGVLLEPRGTQLEKDLFGQFSQSFVELQRIDQDVLALAVKNTNLKAYGLAYGPAAAALTEMDAAVSRLVTKSADFPEARNVALLAFGAQTGALRIQTLLPPHIAEESDQKMDELEALMAREDRKVHENLAGLAALQKLRGDHDVATAVSAFARFSDLKVRILALSRENTNVRSLSMSLNQKRKMLALCQAALANLRQAIQDEPIAGLTTGRPAKPR